MSTPHDKTLHLISITLAQTVLSIFLLMSVAFKFHQIKGILTYILAFISTLLFFASLRYVNEIIYLTQKEAQAKASGEIILSLRSQLHDFQNHIMVIKGSFQLGKQDMAEDYIEQLSGQIKGLQELAALSLPTVSAFLLKQQSVIEQKGINFVLNIKTSLQGIEISEIDLVRILGNLINNAIFALEHVEAETKNIQLDIEKGADGRFMFSVWNDKPHIPVALQQKIFESGFTTKGSQGNGLGLGIVKSIVQKCKGDVKLISTPELGTKFIVNI